MSECVDLGEEVRDKESGRPVVFDSLPLYNHVQRSLRFAQDDNAKQLPRYGRDDKATREIGFVISSSSR